MNNQKMVASLLEECKQILDQYSSEMEHQCEADERQQHRIRAILPDDLRTLIEEAKEMKWPFVPERWQYKQAVDPEDKTNLQDTINVRLQELLVYLKASITARDCMTAAAIVFVIDRFLYWVDGSSQLLQIAKRLHRLQPTTPIAPQLVIRQARISVNSGKLLKAEYILNSLINDSGDTGVWKYSNKSDRILVQSVCVQIRGQILQKLGLWYEAAELIWASILGYFTLPQPDKKGIATSLGILADIFVSMSESDYDRFKNNYQCHLNLLREFDHRLLSAAEACKLAAAYSQFTPLFVLTAVNIRGTSLLSYSYSNACPLEQQKFYLSEAKESFEIGLLSKRDNKLVTSKQELHSFVKAAFCLTKVHQQLYGESENLTQANRWCQEAIEKLYAYSHSPSTGEHSKELLAKDIMCLVMSVKEQLHVECFSNSDAKSYVPDDYRTAVGKQIVNGELSFEEVLKMHSQHWAAVYEDFESNCKNSRRMSEEGKTGACITSLKTETRNMDTMCSTEERAHDGRDTARISISQKGRKNSEGFKSQVQIKPSHVEGINPSCDEETESYSLEKISNEEDTSNESQNRSSSWSRTSKSSSSSSWEKISYDENKLRPDGKEKTNDLTTQEQTSCAAVTEEAEGENQEFSLCSLSSRTQELFLQVAQNGCTSPLKHSFQNHNTAFANTTANSNPHFIEESGEETKNGLNQLSGKGSTTNSKNRNDILSDLMSNTSIEESFGKTVPSGINSRTKENSKKTSSTFSNPQQGNTRQGSRRKPKNSEVEPKSQTKCSSIGPEDHIVGTTKDGQIKPHLPDNRIATASINRTIPNLDRGLFVQNWINKTVTTVATGSSAKMHDVDLQAETVEDWDFASGSRKKSVESTDVCLMKDQTSQRPETTSSSLERNKPLANLSNDCATTQDDENEKPRNALNSSHSSSSSLKSWYKVGHVSSRSSDLESPSILNSSGSSFTFMERTKERFFQAQILTSNDYNKLLAGVEHTWLVERMKNTGLFKPDLLHKGHSALLLKYSKKSRLWTAQETAVYVGDYLRVAKKGKQRNAFWIHFLHQEETLGRYVGKEYKEEKELLHHFCDVERQMTAQYYVTEFNKRLYEQNISTQIFYVPSVVLLVLNGKHIQGCISVEPYILGEFVKLSNNTTVAKREHKATEYGLAFGHFCYEFSQGTDVVVDLQGWVTGNGKGLIYLTDPQIHSLTWQAGSCAMNFGKKGIYYFFNKQHTECNEICHRLSLTRPSPEKLN